MTTEPNAATSFDTLLTPAQAAELLTVSVDSLEKWRRNGTGPRHLKLSGRVVRYTAADLQAFLITAASGGPAQQPTPSATVRPPLRFKPA